jgi:hypothetical protein
MSRGRESNDRKGRGRAGVTDPIEVAEGAPPAPADSDAAETLPEYRIVWWCAARARDVAAAEDAEAAADDGSAERSD